MKNCWAKAYQECGGGLSGEHLIPHGMFKQGKVITVQGLKWCADVPKTVGIKALTANILCRDHNSALSLLDDTAIAAFDIFRKKTHINRLKVSPIDLLLEKTPQVNGLLFERWFLKTLLNHAVTNNSLIGPTGVEPGIPPADLVEVVFGGRPFPPGAGLSALVAIGMPIKFNEEIALLPIYEDGTRLMGAVFSFFGVAFLLWLGGENTRLQHSTLQKLMPVKWGTVEALLTPPRTIRLNMTPMLSIVVLELVWDVPIEIHISKWGDTTYRA